MYPLLCRFSSFKVELNYVFNSHYTTIRHNPSQLLSYLISPTRVRRKRAVSCGGTNEDLEAIHVARKVKLINKISFRHYYSTPQIHQRKYYYCPRIEFSHKTFSFVAITTSHKVMACTPATLRSSTLVRTQCSSH